MTHATIRLDAATEARVRQAADELDRHVEDPLELTSAEAAAAYVAGREDGPAIGTCVLHPLLLAVELHA